jgi:AraC family transcriptional regulator
LRSTVGHRAATSSAYVERINLAIDYVVSRLGEPLRLEDVARAAHLSAFHFHRVFRALVGVTLADFVKRLRLDKALYLMAHSQRPSLTSIALASGFASSSDFSRGFKQRFGVPPSVFDIRSWREAHRSQVEATLPEAAKRLHLQSLPVARNPDRFRVTIRSLPARTVAYIRVANPYKFGGVVKAVERLLSWAERHSLADGQWLGYQWESPEIVALEDCYYNTAVEAEHFIAKGEIGRFRFPPMTVAQVEIRGSLDLELRALQWLYGVWLPTSGYEPDDQPCFEAWIGRPFAHGGELFELYVQLPVRRV